MSDIKKLKEAHTLFAEGKREKAVTLFLEVFHTTPHDEERLDAVIALVDTLDQLEKNDELIEIANAGIEIATKMGREELRQYLLSKKVMFLASDFSTLVYTKQNIKLSALAFDWMGFSVEKDRDQFELFSRRKMALEDEMSVAEKECIDATRGENHYLNGRIFLSLSAAQFSMYIAEQIDLVSRGGFASKMANMYWVRRLRLQGFILFKNKDRRLIESHLRQSSEYFLRAFQEFRSAQDDSSLAYAFFNYAAQLTIVSRFREARKYLKLSRDIAVRQNDSVLIGHLNELEARIKDRNRNIRDYVEEQGLDLPEAVRPR